LCCRPCTPSSRESVNPTGQPLAAAFSTRSPGEELQRLIAAEKFRATLPAKLDAAVDAWHAAQPKAPDPVIDRAPYRSGFAAGDSQLLGGAMEIKAPWKRE
jgi:hypothetical protein